MEKGLISIIIPIYNAQKFIARCLTSLVNQTYSNIEILCVDDCSVDNSAEIVENFSKKDNRIKLFKNDKNSGPATTRNVGLKNANGEFIMFCDNDDEYKQNMCEVMINTITNQNVDLVICRADIVNSEFDVGLAKYINGFEVGKFKLENRYKDLICILVWNKIYRKTIIDNYNIKFPDGLSSEDDAFVYTYIMSCANYCGLADDLYKHYFHEASYTQTQGKYKMGDKLFDKIKIIEYIYSFAKKYNILEKEAEFLKIIFSKEINYLLAYCLNKKSKTKIVSLYNQFVENNNLDWKEYNFKALRLSDNKKTFINLIKLFFKCTWF